MEFAKLLGICVICALVSVLLKNSSPPFALLLSVFVSVSIVGVCTMYFLPYLDFFSEVTQGTSFSSYAGVLIKTCAIGILTRLAAEICRDAGEGAFAGKAELVGKTAILICALPVIKTLFEQIKEFLN